MQWRITKVYGGWIIEYKKVILEDDTVMVYMPNGTKYSIDKDQVYSNRKVFSMNVNLTLKAINSTVDFLKETNKE